MACNDLLDYPDFKGEFNIHTDASKVYLGAFIRHKVKLIPFYSRRLTDAQKR